MLTDIVQPDFSDAQVPTTSAQTILAFASMFKGLRIRVLCWQFGVQFNGIHLTIVLLNDFVSSIDVHFHSHGLRHEFNSCSPAFVDHRCNIYDNVV
jgi:hypothetical protein